MDLIVKFTGLCMFVRDPGGKRVHVLMPATPSRGRHHHDLTLKIVDACVTYDLRHWMLDLSGAGGKGASTYVPDEVLDAGKPVFAHVDAKQWSDRPRNTVVGRVTLPPFNEITYDQVVEWDVRVIREGGKRPVSRAYRRLTNEVTCRVNEVDHDFFDRWKLLPLRRGGSIPVPLRPPAGADATLEIKHIPKVSEKTGKGDEAPDFHHFYRIFKPRPDRRARPFLNQKPPVSPGGSPFNCILAQAPPE